MLTKRTQRAIEIIHEIAFCQSQTNPVQQNTYYCTQDYVLLLRQLQQANIIRLLPGKVPDSILSYELSMEMADVTLFQLLTAIGESINLLLPSADEEHIYKYHHYGIGASKLGVVNQMLRTLLSEINILDL